MVAHIFNPNIQEAEVESSLQGRLVPHSKTLSQRKQTNGGNSGMIHQGRTLGANVK